MLLKLISFYGSTIGKLQECATGNSKLYSIQIYICMYMYVLTDIYFLDNFLSSRCIQYVAV